MGERLKRCAHQLGVLPCPKCERDEARAQLASLTARQVELEGWLETADRERGELKEELLKAGPLRLEIERLRRALERICAYTFESDRGAYNLAQAALSADQEGEANE